MTERSKRKDKIQKIRQDQILNAALSQFSSKGFGETTMSDIAQAAGIAVGTIYNYYPDKNELLLALLSRELFFQQLIELLSDLSLCSSDDYLETAFKERLSAGLDYAQKTLFLFFEIQRSPKLRQKYVNNCINPLLDRIEEYVSKQIKENNFRSVDEKIVAWAITSTIIGNMILYRLESTKSPIRKSNIKHTAQEFSKLYLYGLKKK